MTVNDELSIIQQTRAEVMGQKELTGENLFLAWGYPTAFFLLLEFAAIIIWGESWCDWLWIGIPLVGTPLMIHLLQKDYERTGRCTLDQNVILMMWVFIGCASCLGGAAMGFAGVFESCYMAYLSLLCGMGCFLTGIILHFRPKTVCGIVASVLSAMPLFFQGDRWYWQLPIAAAITVVALIIPGHLFRNHVKNYGL